MMKKIYFFFLQGREENESLDRLISKKSLLKNKKFIFI
jgi:hypothetical protein